MGRMLSSTEPFDSIDFAPERQLIASARAQAALAVGSTTTSDSKAPSALSADSASSINADTSTSGTCSVGSCPYPQSFPGYEVVGEPLHGGQGLVFKAVQRSTQRLVAIKLMREGPFAGVAERARFEREIQILGLIRHPNIVAIHGAGVVAGSHYYVMDFVSGRSLDEYILQQRPDKRQVLSLFAKISEAVHAAHQLGIVHRDLKPSNVFVDERSEPLILDFGLAKRAIEGAALPITETGQFLGSLPWVAPEQAEGRQSTIDARTDVYALGMMLYFVLTGGFPYSVSGSVREVLDHIINDVPVRPARKHRAIDDEMETMILKCLQKDRDRRYQTAGDFARDLRCYLSGEPIEAKRDSTIYLLRKQLRRNLVPFSIAGAFLVTIVVALVVSAAEWHRAETQWEAAELSKAQALAVTGFLTDTLSTANPYVGDAANPRVGEVLNGAMQRAESTFSDQPLVRAAIYDSLFGAFDALGRFADADTCATRSLALRRQWCRPDDPQLIQSLRNSATVASKLARHAEADQLAREALQVAQRTNGPDHTETAESLVTLAVVLNAQGRYAESEPILRDAVERHSRLHGPEHELTVMAQFRLAGCLYELARIDEARPIFEQVVERSRRSLDPDHPDIANRLSSLGAVVHLAGELSAAEEMHREALEIRRRRFGDEHIYVANSLNNLGFVLTDLGRFDEAEPLYQQSLDLRRRLYGPRRIEVTFALNGLARLYLQTDRAAEAETLLRESLDIFAETLPDHWRRGYTQCLLGATLTGLGQLDDAEALLDQGVPTVLSHRGHADMFSQEVLRYITDFYLLTGRQGVAEPYRKLIAAK